MQDTRPHPGNTITLLKVIQSKVKKRKTLHINIYVESRHVENGTDDLIFKTEIETQTENKHMDAKGQKWGVMN